MRFNLNSYIVRSTDDTTAAPAPVPSIVAPAGTPIAKADLRAIAAGKQPTVKRTPKLASKPATATKPAKQAAPAVALKPAKPASGVTRTIATIARHATNFDTLSDRDECYLAFYARFAKAAAGGVVTVKAIAESGKRPAYNGSSKPHDAGVINRLTKAGLLTQRDGSAAFTFTALGLKHKAYTSATKL